MAHEDGTILACELYPVAEACGLSSEQVRSCLRRLVAEGLFTRSGTGRHARWTPTETGLRVLESTLERTRLAYRQDREGRGWDRLWRLVAFAIPETRRSARDAFRQFLTDSGGAPVHNGLYVSPHPWHEEVLREAKRLDVEDNVTTITAEELSVGGVSDPRELARRLWNLDALAERYRRFCSEYGWVPEVLDEMRRNRRKLADAEFLPAALVIGVRFTECFIEDPLLPPELLPRPWPGREARELLVRSRRLGLLLREQHERPRLFSLYDDATAPMT